MCSLFSKDYKKRERDKITNTFSWSHLRHVLPVVDKQCTADTKQMITGDSSCVAKLSFELLCKQSESTADLSLFPYLFSLVRYSVVEI